MRKTRQAAEISELKVLLLQFRVVDLQLLLGDENIYKSSRKTELQERATTLLKKNSSEFKNKLRAIYKKIPQHNASPGITEPPNIEVVNNNRIASTMYQQQYANAVQSDNRNGVVVPYSDSYPINPDVKLKKLAFFDILATLMKPSTLIPTNNTQRVQEGSFFFHLTPLQASDIAINRDIRNINKVEHTIQVQLRFCLLETSCEQEDYFPPNISVKVNNKLCPLPNPIPTNKPGVEPKRPPRPVNITPNVKLSPTVANHIAVSWCTEYNRGYAAACYLVRKLSSSQLLQRLKTKGIKPADYTRALIKEKLNEDADCEIATTMLKVSLICPLGKMRMSTPCRSSTCSHLQCFDASLYLQMNERKPTWNCPVCDKPAVYDNLVIDGYFQEVLASTKLSLDDNEIQLHKDGSWSTHISKNDTCNVDTPSKPVQKVEVISDDIEVITDAPKATIKLQANATSNSEPTSTTAPSNETVDLTISDSDEDDLPLKRKIVTRSAVNNGGAATAKQKINIEDPSSSVISLDSPSPPSTPNPPPYNNATSMSNNVSSTTASSLPFQLPIDQPANYQINPMAISRFEAPDDLQSFIYQQRLMSESQQYWNGSVGHPYGYDDNFNI